MAGGPDVDQGAGILNQRLKSSEEPGAQQGLGANRDEDTEEDLTIEWELEPMGKTFSLAEFKRKPEVRPWKWRKIGPVGLFLSDTGSCTESTRTLRATEPDIGDDGSLTGDVIGSGRAPDSDCGPGV